MDVMTEAEAKHPDHRLSREGEFSAPQHPSVSADDRAQRNASARERRGEADPATCGSRRGFSLLQDEMSDGAVGRELKSPNRGLLRVQQTEGGAA